MTVLLPRVTWAVRVTRAAWKMLGLQRAEAVRFDNFFAIIYLFTGNGFTPCSLVMLLQTSQANVVVFEHLL